MTRTSRLMGSAAALCLMFAVSTAPAKAQFAGFGASSGGEDMMTQFAPMLEMMKAKMGKKRFGMLMQTMGPMMAKMMDGGGGFGGMNFGSIMGGGIMGGGMTPGVSGFGDTPLASGGGFTNALGGFGGSEMMSMIPQLMSLANVGGGKHRRHRARR